LKNKLLSMSFFNFRFVELTVTDFLTQKFDKKDANVQYAGSDMTGVALSSAIGSIEEVLEAGEEYQVNYEEILKKTVKEAKLDSTFALWHCLRKVPMKLPIEGIFVDSSDDAIVKFNIVTLKIMLASLKNKKKD